MSERGRLLHRAEHVAWVDLLTGVDGRLEVPASLPVERRRRHPARDHRRAPRVRTVAREHAQRALRAVEDRAEQARAELHLERLAGVDHRLPGGQPRRVLVDLDHHLRAVEADHLARQAGVPDLDDVVQARRREALRYDHRACDAVDLADRT